MRNKLIMTLFIVLMSMPCFGAFTNSVDNRRTYKNAYRWTGKPKDKLLVWAQEVEDRLIGTSTIEQSLYSPTDSPVGTTKGTLYYDLSEEKFKYRNASAWVAIESGSATGYAVLVINSKVEPASVNAVSFVN